MTGEVKWLPHQPVMNQMMNYLDPTMLTCQTLMRFSEYPANKIRPSALHARERHCGGSALADPGTSGLSSSTRFLLSRSQTLMVGPVAEHSQYLQMDKHKF